MHRDTRKGFPAAYIVGVSTDYDPTDLRGQEVTKAEQAERERLAQEVEDSDIRWLMHSGKGRRIVWRLLDFAGVTRNCFDPNALRMAFLVGNQNCGNFFLAQIMRICPDDYILMLKEAKPKGNKNVRDSDGNGQKHN